MAALTIQNASKSYAGQTVLSDITLELQKGEKVGLIGANGSGKTTLFRLIMGETTPDHGVVTKTKGLTVSHLPQEPNLDHNACLIDVVAEPFAEHRRLEVELQQLTAEMAELYGTPDEKAVHDRYDRLHARFEADGGYSYEVRIREVLGGLGFSPDEYKQQVDVLSGGQKCRASLARMLMTGADFLLLDEPTNHLDIDATRWLEKYLAMHTGGAVIISHDRYLLDRVVSKVIEIEDHQATVYPTNYSNYAEAKRIRQLQAVRAYQKQRTWVAHQKDYINRARYKKDTAKQARSRRKLLDNMTARGEILNKPGAEKPGMKLRFDPHAKGGDMVVRCKGVCKGYGSMQLIKDLDYEMTVGQTVGIIGPNGVGKTTLLRMLLGTETPDAGTVRLFENLSVGYYDQEHRGLDGDQSVMEAVREARPEVSETEARSYLALFLFRGDDVFKRVGDLSGGEQSRVLLARLVWTNPQVLVLDEPTNHLDIPAREALEEALTLYSGSILMVSHDRYFLDRIATQLLAMPRRAQHEIVEGNWTTYAKLIAEREEAERLEQARQQTAARAHEKSKRTGRGGKKKSKSKYAAKRLEDLEASIIRIETRVKEVETGFADPAMMKDQAKYKDLQIEYDQLRKQLETLNEQWEEAVEAQQE